MVENPLAGLQNFFFAGDKADPRVNQDLRQRIALAVMQRQSKYPKTLGEGLSAIGEAIGDRGIANSLLSGDLAQQDAAQKRATELLGGGQTSAAGAPQTTAYAPPSDAGATTPPAAADASATPAGPAQPPPDLVNTPDQPIAALYPSPPSDGLVPGAPATPDQTASLMSPTPMVGQQQPPAAPAGFKPTPNYMRDAIARNIHNPTLRAYAGAMVAGEDPTGGSVSSTGASGPYQFLRSTAKQYNLANPSDPDASTKAFLKLTQDNAAAFEKINGRPPTAPELALMHQQGGVTGARMVAGTGNASGRNLSVNNVNPNASPQQAVAAIQKYYGMPNVPVNVRDSIAATMSKPPPGMAGAAPIVPAGMSPQAAPPVMARGGDPSGQPLAFNGQPQQPPLPPAITSGIQKAPPNVQVAQNGPPQPGYVPPAAAPVQGAPVIPPGAEETKLATEIARDKQRGGKYLEPYLAPRLQALQAERAQRQNEANEVFKSQLLQAAKQNELRLTGQMDAPKRIADIQKTQAEIEKDRLQETEGKLVRNDDGSYSPPRVTGVDPNAIPHPKMNEQQAKSQMFHSWTSLAEEQLDGKDKILAEGLKDQLAGKVPFAGNKVMSAQYRRAYAAAERFVQGFLRDVSGNAISPEEMVKHQNSFLPRYGDDPATIADKKAARENVIQGMYAGSGPGSAISDYQTKQRRDTQAASDARLNDEMKDAPKVVGKVLINPAKPNISRVWNGKRWEEY